MNSRRPRLGFGSGRLRVLAIVCAAGIAAAGAGLLSGFRADVRPVTPAASSIPSESGVMGSELTTTEIVGIRTYVAPTDVLIDADVEFGNRPDGTLLTLDVCSPPPGTRSDPTVVERRPAVISIHGGSWSRGDKANSDWRGVCTWLAAEGFVAVSVNYRLAPTATFPAAIDDVAEAVDWMRLPENADRYGVDTARIGAFGGSAGGNLAALLGARGTGSLTHGQRVSAVAVVSAPFDLRDDALAFSDGQGRTARAVPIVGDLRQIALRYLGCARIVSCPAAAAASAPTRLDASDPPVFIGASAGEFVPVEQATGYAQDLARLGIAHELVVVPGALHSIGILDAEMRERIAAFLHDTLGS